jgi:hypothetical protein
VFPIRGPDLAVPVGGDEFTVLAVDLAEDSDGCIGASTGRPLTAAVLNFVRPEAPARPRSRPKRSRLAPAP